jgi:energy-coupling factor transporter ATP-binding protein EcfA2
MNWKIDEITLTNFKFFKDEFSLAIAGKHVLLYGENGSGKSSIYWGLYTLLQGRLKNHAELMKYFDSGHDENLKNRYCRPEEDTKIEVLFKDFDNPADTKSYKLGSTEDNLHTAGDTFLAYTAASCDFFNYKFVSSLSDFRNSQKVELFDLFEREVFSVIEFRSAYTDIHGNQPTTGGTTAIEWWKYMNEAIPELPKRKKRHTQINKGSDEYRKFKDLLKAFCEELDYYLTGIEGAANTILHDRLNMPNVDIVLASPDEIEFNELISGDTYDGKLHKPKIFLTAKLQDVNLPGGETTIEHLKTYFNEAKLTSICLSIRMAIAEKKLNGANDLVSFLCVDDLLISLDMSKRMPVINLLMEEAEHFQLLVFTHDRSFFNIMRNTIIKAGKEEAWKMFELYEMDRDMSEKDYPEPYLKKSGSYLESAKYQITIGDYPAAANYLRKYAEQLIKAMLPENMQKQYATSEENKGKLLSALYETLKNDFCTAYDFPVRLIPDLDFYRERLMNPLSHDDGHTPIFKQELLDCIEELEKFQPLIGYKKVVLGQNQLTTQSYKIEMTNAALGITMWVDFELREQWDMFDLPVADGGRKYKNSEIKVTASGDVSIVPIGKIMPVKKLRAEVYRAVRLNDDNSPVLGDCVREISGARRLLSGIG